MSKKIIVRELNLQDYKKTFLKMCSFTKNRTINTNDEIWLVEHFPVFTQGRSEAYFNYSSLKKIPIIKSDRGGKITFHGPGQQIVYVLLELCRYQLNAYSLVKLLERSIISTLFHFSIISHTKKNFPGVYVNNEKICSIGLRINNGFSLHGLALNVNMNLKPFLHICPCGDVNLKMTQMSNFSSTITIKQVKSILIKNLLKLLNFSF